MEIACKIDRIHGKQRASGKRFGLGGFDLKLFRLKKIDEKAENFAVVTKAQLEIELPFLMGSATSELNGAYFFFVFLFRILSTRAHGLTKLDESFSDQCQDF